MQFGRSLAGTIAIDGVPAPVAGAYIINGKATGKKVRVSGTNGVGGFLKWTGKVVGTSIRGTVKVRAAFSPLSGTLSLTRNPPLADGSSCDAVYTQNASFFDQQILGSALRPCASCHIPAGQAAVTRFRVTLTDALATARSVAPLIDSANPSASRIIEKPTGMLPHGGAKQIEAGSTQDENLRHWVDLVAQAHCE